MSGSKSELAARNLRIIENYNDALSIIRNRYFDQANSQPMNSSEQSDSIDQLLILDFMIDSNQRILNYLNHFKKHQHALSTQALEDILSTLIAEDREDIHATILRFQNNIMLQGPNVSETLKNDYNFRGSVYGTLAISSFILTMALAVITQIMVEYYLRAAIVAVFGFEGLTLFAIMYVAFILAGAVFSFDCHWQTNLFAQPGHFFYQDDTTPLPTGFERRAPCLEVLMAPQPAPEDSNFTKSYEMTYTERSENHSLITTTTTLFAHQKQQLKSVLREKFTHKLARAVEIEYTTLNRLNR